MENPAEIEDVEEKVEEAENEQGVGDVWNEIESGVKEDGE